MSCVSCNKPAQYYCGKCMRVKYCGDSCQKSHFKQHTSKNICVPFYFVAGQTKRTAEGSKEEEEKAESDYIKLYAAYKRSGENPSFVPQLEELFGKLSLEAQSKYRDGLPCHDGVDPLSQEEVSTLEADNRFYLMTNNIKYCFNLDLLVGYVKSMQARDPTYGRRTPINPINRQPFSEADMQRLNEAGEIRLLTVWEKFRLTNDATTLTEVIDTLGMYEVEPHIITGAKSDRLKKEMKNMDLTDICSMLEKYPLLNILGLTLDMIPWESAQDPSGCSDKFKKLFKTKDELKSAFWGIPSFQAFLQKLESVAQSLLQAFFPRKVLLAPKKNYFYNLKLSFLDYYLSFPKTGKKFLVVPKENQTLQQAYKEAYRTHYSINLLGLPNERNLVSEQWLAFHIYWSEDDMGDEENDPTPLFTNELPWWPEYPDLSIVSKRYLKLVIRATYQPPHFEIDFNFLDFAKNIQPPSIPASMINGNDILKPWEELNKWFSKWPQNWTFPFKTSALYYKVRIDLMQKNRFIDTTFSNDITIPPAKELWELFQKKDVFTELDQEITYRIVINLVYSFNDLYTEGIGKFQSYVEWGMPKGMDLSHIDWEKIPYNEKDENEWNSVFYRFTSYEHPLKLAFFKKYFTKK